MDRKSFFEAERTLFGVLALSLLVNVFFAFQWTKTIGQREVARYEAKRWGVKEAACREREKLVDQVALVAFDFAAKCKDGSLVHITTQDWTAKEEYNDND